MPDDTPSAAQPSSPILDDSGQKWAALGCGLGVLTMLLQMTGKLPDAKPYLSFFSDILMPLIIGTYVHRSVNAYRQ